MIGCNRSATSPARTSGWEAYRFAFASPNGWKNLLIGGVAMLVPILGPVVFIGYLCDVLAPRPLDDGSGRVDESPRAPGAGYGDFDFSRFSQYLERGIWPFLATLVAGLVMLPLYFLAMAPAIVAAVANFRGPAAMLAFFASFVLFLAVAAAGVLVMVPLSVRAAMLMEFGPTFDPRWVKDFAARTWRETVIAMLFLIVTGFPLAIVGYLLCLIGVYPAMALLTLAEWHLHFQLYHLYVSRGGAPVPVKPIHRPGPPPIRMTPPAGVAP
jgi:hypothetical protein